MTKILVIDDEDLIRQRLENLLKLDEYEVYVATRGDEGIDVFNKENPDIIVVDIKMPGMDGIEVLKSIKQKTNFAEVIMITGHGGEDLVIQALQEGAFYYIKKPIDYDELKLQIIKIVEKQEMKKKLDEYVWNLEYAFEEKNKELILRKKAEQALQDNINQGREYQEKLIKIKFPKIYNMKFYSKYLPYDIVGGDIYNLIKKNNKIIFYLCDLAGHGVPSAILSAFIKAHIDNWIIKSNIVSPKDLVLLLKETLKEEEIFNENMLTIFIGYLNIENLNFTYVSAGHFLPFIIEKNEMHKNNFINLKKTFMPITNIIESDGYEDDTIALKNNTKIFIYSDGLIEWIDEKNNFIGTKGLRNFIKKNGLSNESLEIFLSQGSKYHIQDDISYILIEINDCFEKTYFCDLNNYDIIKKDFENEVENRYNNSDFNYKCCHCFIELVLNGIEHGNKNNPKKALHINVKFNNDSITISIEDEGKGFDWKNIDFLKSSSSDDLRNRGLFLVNKFASNIEFNENGNKIKTTILS